MPTSATQYNLNFAGAQPVTLTNGSANLNVDTGSYAIDSSYYYPFMNIISIINYDNTGAATPPKKVNFLKNAHMLVKFSGNIGTGQVINDKSKMSEVFSNLALCLPAPVQLTSSTGYSLITGLSSSEILSLLNMVQYMRFGFLMEYTKVSTGAAAVAYYFPTISSLSFSPATLPKCPYPSAITSLLDNRTLPGSGGSLVGTTSIETQSGYMSSSLFSGLELAGTIVSCFGVTYSDITTGVGSVTISPIMFIGNTQSPTTGTYSKMALLSSSNIASASLTVQNSINPAMISVANKDTDNADSYSDSYGWIGTYDSGSTNDSTITITVA